MADETGALGPAAFLEWCSTRREDAITLLEELVNIDSGPGQIQGLTEVIEIADREMTALGMKIERVTLEGGIPALIARSQATGPRILLLAHLDTVFPPGTSTDRPFRRESDRAFGPGVADMKGGFVGMWLALKCLSHAGILPRLPVDVLVNTDEESGSGISRSLIEHAAEQAAWALVFEPARPSGDLVSRRRGHRRFKVMMTGKAAHTGVEPEKGANAIVALSKLIAALDQAVPSFPSDTSLTVSLVSGGTGVNIVPDLAVASVDVRVPDTDAADRIEAIISELASRTWLEGTQANLVKFAERPPMFEVPGAKQLMATLEGAASSLGLPIRFTATGGGSDGGITSSMAVPTIDGLGPVGGGYHTADEFLLLATLPERAAIAAAALVALLSD